MGVTHFLAVVQALRLSSSCATEFKMTPQLAPCLIWICCLIWIHGFRGPIALTQFTERKSFTQFTEREPLSPAHGLQFLCGGALISDHYVLTAAHCVEETENARLVGVRLGEHDTDTDPDCSEYSDGVQCGNPVQRRRVAEVAAHPKYRNRRGEINNDIAVIRMDHPARMTDFVVPICLPNGAALRKQYEGESMFVAGWGKTENSSSSNVKLWVRVPVVPNRRCAPIYSHQITLGGDQMCAGGREGKDSCAGDSGGPLMAIDDVVAGRRGGQWVAVGVVSYGPVFCATGGRPGVYTRVSSHMRWILDSLEP